MFIAARICIESKNEYFRVFEIEDTHDVDIDASCSELPWNLRDVIDYAEEELFSSIMTANEEWCSSHSGFYELHQAAIS